MMHTAACASTPVCVCVCVSYLYLSLHICVCTYICLCPCSPIRPWTGSDDSRTLSLPGFLDNRHKNVADFTPPPPQEIILVEAEPTLGP